MAAAFVPRDDYYGVALRDLAKQSDDTNQTWRLLASVIFLNSGRRREAPGAPRLRASSMAEGLAVLVDCKVLGQAAKVEAVSQD
ncbi:hypothetical protein N9F34_02350 [Alphaproteobacteria bacterium]|nr:hypothetical protein [Alphaproteobacteria bacterium]